MSGLFPLLNSGVTLDIFKRSGKTPVLNDSFIIKVKGY